MQIYIRKEPYWWQTYYFIVGMILSGLAVCLIIIMLTRKIVLKKQREKQMVQELRFDATYARINPHFIFNSLSVALYHIKTNRAADAARYINRFSRLLRSYLKNSRERYTSIKEEVMHLEDYIVLQQERFEQRFSYTISMESEIDSSLKVPTLLLQPFVENAIRHGLWHKEGKGHLLVSFHAAAGGLRICIDDNGIGREKAKELNKEQPNDSYGNELINNLVRLFNTYEEIRLHINHTDKTAPETGTIVTITIQYLE